MPSLRNLLHVHNGDEKSEPRSPKSPKSPRSPKSPKTIDFCKTEKNPDRLNQCYGCSNIEILIRRNIEHQQNGLALVSTAKLHNNFEELDKCAQRCEICRVFRQALILAEVTFDGVKELWDVPGEVIVRWKETKAPDDIAKVSLYVELGGQLSHAGVVNCHSYNDVGHLALHTNGLDAAVIEQAKGWLDTCLNSHFGQCDNLKWSSENPELLIEILSPTTIQLRRSQEGAYAALSYCWGDIPSLPKAQRNEVEQGKTLTTNLIHRLEPFPMSTLPSTVRDALSIIHAMGIRYAWIDTLCIVQDDPKGVETMHKIYSNALFTLCSCATTQATAHLLDQREAWTQRTEPCRLGGQWLTTPDMSLNELRLRSPLAERAWTLQEERLSPRMLYMSSSRIYWSCAQSHDMEMKPTYGRKDTPLHRPVYAASDRNAQMPIAQEFLLACYSGKSDLHAYWADTVNSYSKRSMSNISDRLKALSGVAAKYLSASRGDEYLAGIWANNLPEGLAWRVQQAVDVEQSQTNPTNKGAPWPSWSWAVLPLHTSVEISVKSEMSSYFRRSANRGISNGEIHEEVDESIRRGQEVKELQVMGRLRKVWEPTSHHVNWSTISKSVEGEEKFSFAVNPEQDVHAIEAESGRVLVYENRKREVIGQLDFQRDVKRLQSEQVEIWALELGISTMLLLERIAGERWRRVGVAWHVRQGYFSSPRIETLILQ